MSPRARTTRLVAPAKLTLSLRVLGVRPDGFHELEAEMVSVDLVDDLFIDPNGIELDIELDGVSAGPPSDVTNLVSRALRAVGRQAGIRLVKRIPMGGGLGGGSSDAAAILRWARCRDLGLAARLGADVPFCVVGGRARVGGLGQVITPLSFQPRTFVLLVPPLAVDTAAVYRAWDRLPEEQRQAPEIEPNDLSAAAVVVEPALQQWRERLGELSGRTPRLAGSGATWFVEGTPELLSIDPERPVVLDGQIARVIAVHTVPSGYGGP